MQDPKITRVSFEEILEFQHLDLDESISPVNLVLLYDVVTREFRVTGYASGEGAQGLHDVLAIDPTTSRDIVSTGKIYAGELEISGDVAIAGYLTAKYNEALVVDYGDVSSPGNDGFIVQSSTGPVSTQTDWETKIEDSKIRMSRTTNGVEDKVILTADSIADKDGTVLYWGTANASKSIVIGSSSGQAGFDITLVGKTYFTSDATFGSALTVGGTFTALDIYGTNSLGTAGAITGASLAVSSIDADTSDIETMSSKFLLIDLGDITYTIGTPRHKNAIRVTATADYGSVANEFNTYIRTDGLKVTDNLDDLRSHYRAGSISGYNDDTSLFAWDRSGKITIGAGGPYMSYDTTLWGFVYVATGLVVADDAAITHPRAPGNNNHLTNKKYVDDRIWTGTAYQYSQITSVAGVLYVITD